MQAQTQKFLRRALCRSKLAVWLLFLLGCWMPLNLRAIETPEAPFRLGFTSCMFSDVNENDARAAVRAWGALIANEQNVPTSPDPAIFKDIAALRRSLHEKEVDAVGITLIEYAQLLPEIHFAPIFITYNAGSMTERYVLLAHREGTVKTLADLRDRSLYLHSNPRACLAPLWLDTLLVEQGHPKVNHFVGTIIQNTKLSNVVLSVFFRQVDACIVTRSGFDTMSELNPQLAQQLSVLAESPTVVPAVFAFRADYNPSFKEKLIAGINTLKTTPAGRQVLTIFHSENIEVHPENCLDSALELIAAHAQITRKPAD